MAIARNPKRNQPTVGEDQAQAFISGVGAAIKTPQELIDNIRDNGIRHPKMIAAELNARHIEAPGGGEWSTPQVREFLENKKPIMIRVDPDTLRRIDRAAMRLNISRSAFIVSSAMVRLESME